MHCSRASASRSAFTRVEAARVLILYMLLAALTPGGGANQPPAEVRQQTLPVGGFHRRVLPAPAIAYSSAEGKALFKQSLAQGNADIFFRVSEAFRTQDEPTYCGLGTLVTVLNALEIDPGTIWKGSWRWYSESMLECVHNFSPNEFWTQHLLFSHFLPARSLLPH